MPFPFVKRATFERELQYTALDVGIQSESDWNAVLDEALKAASERVGGYATAIDSHAEWYPDDATIPFVVRESVIRLARQRVAAIMEDGLSSEDLVSGAGYDYRPPADIREEVKADLDEHGYRIGDDADDDFVLTG